MGCNGFTWVGMDAHGLGWVGRGFAGGKDKDRDRVLWLALSQRQQSSYNRLSKHIRLESIWEKLRGRCGRLGSSPWGTPAFFPVARFAEVARNSHWWHSVEFLSSKVGLLAHEEWRLAIEMLISRSWGTRHAFLHNYLLLKHYLLFRVVYNGVHVQSHVAFGFPSYWLPLFFWSSHCQGSRTCGLLFLHNYLPLKPYLLFWVVFNSVHIRVSCALFCKISTYLLL